MGLSLGSGPGATSSEGKILERLSLSGQSRLLLSDPPVEAGARAELEASAEDEEEADGVATTEEATAEMADASLVAGN